MGHAAAAHRSMYGSWRAVAWLVTPAIRESGRTDYPHLTSQAVISDQTSLINKQ